MCVGIAPFDTHGAPVIVSGGTVRTSRGIKGRTAGAVQTTGLSIGATDRATPRPAFIYGTTNGVGLTAFGTRVIDAVFWMRQTEPNAILGTIRRRTTRRLFPR